MDNPRYREIFFEVFEGLPRQGPGSRACTQRALSLCAALPASPAILDLGCGTGAQTFHLAELTSGSIVAVDAHAPSIVRLARAIDERKLSHRLRTLVADIAELPLAAASFDLVWSEGALYNLGLERALNVCRGLLRPGGYLAFTDAVWRRQDPPDEVKASFASEYPTMGGVDDVVREIAAAGLQLVGHFTLPDDTWWDGFYIPMERRIAALRRRYVDDAEARSILDELAREPEMHRRYCTFYAYEFFVARRRGLDVPTQ